MDELDYLGQLPRVRAPLGFEAGVLARLAERRERRSRRLKTLRFSLAGASAFLLVAFVVTRFLVAPSGTAATASSNPAGAPAARVIPINEPVDYTREVRDLSRDSGTIYILEQVSDITTADISY